MTHRLFGMSILLAALATGGCSTLGTQISTRLPGAREADETLLSIARLNERQGRLGEARRQYEQIVRRQPEHFEAWHRLSLVYTQLEERDAADRAFQKARAMQPNNADLLADYGYALFLREELTEAETILRQALRESPRHKRAVNNLAIVLAHHDQWEESYSLFRQAVGEAEAHANLGYLHTQFGNGRQAVEHYSRALTLDPQLASASQAMYQLAQLQQRLEQAAPASSPAAVADLSGSEQADTSPAIQTVDHAELSWEPRRESVVNAHAEWTGTLQNAAHPQ
jgi:Tfp pilus assembly protein PilF